MACQPLCLYRSYTLCCLACQELFFSFFVLARLPRQRSLCIFQDIFHVKIKKLPERFFSGSQLTLEHERKYQISTTTQKTPHGIGFTRRFLSVIIYGCNYILHISIYKLIVVLPQNSPKNAVLPR